MPVLCRSSHDKSILSPGADTRVKHKVESTPTSRAHLTCNSMLLLVLGSNTLAPLCLPASTSRATILAEPACRARDWRESFLNQCESHGSSVQPAVCMPAPLTGSGKPEAGEESPALTR